MPWPDPLRRIGKQVGVLACDQYPGPDPGCRPVQLTVRGFGSHRYLLWVVLTLLSLAGMLGASTIETYHTETLSPDGHYRTVARKNWLSSLLPAMPGQGSDAPGSITIYEVATGRSLGRQPVDTIWFVHAIRWQDGRAYIPAVASWPLQTLQNRQPSGRNPR